jgi:mannose-6-phosphate isomerase-like protein (cupin superfamily)
MTGLDLAATYLSLNGSGVATELPGADFMERLGHCPEDMAYLVGIYPQTADWPHWEMHPKGHELLVMLDGRLELTLDRDGEVTTAMLEPGGSLLVPPGVWHVARVLRPGRMIGVTYGEGTQHRPL